MPTTGEPNPAAERMVRLQVEIAGRPRCAGARRACAAFPVTSSCPPASRGAAYEDHPVAIGHGQTISQPYIVAFMTEALELRGAERVLEIGTGSGYQTAVLAELCAEVCSVERIAELADRARAALQYAGVPQRPACAPATAARGGPSRRPSTGSW